MKLKFLLLCFTLVFAVPSFAQKKNGKVTIDVTNGGKEKGRMKNGQREGTWKTYNAKGKLIKEENFLNGRRHGEFMIVDDSMLYTGNYLLNSKDGVFITRVNGRVVSEINYKNDTLHGKYFMDTQNKKISGTYDHGRKVGLRVTDSLDYNKDKIHDSTYYRNGLRDGISVQYRNGKADERTTWLAGKRHGPYWDYDSRTGALLTIGNYSDDKREGTWRDYENGKVKKVDHYANGLHSANTVIYGADTTVTSEVMSYHANGELKVATQYFDNGVLSHRMYYSDQANFDSSFAYHTNGKLKSAHYTTYTNNAGLTQYYRYESYYANGKLQSKGYKHRMEKTGTWLEYDSTGKLRTSISYEENKPFGWFMAYHPNGKLKLKAYCYESVTDTILVYDMNGIKIPQSNPKYSATIAEVQKENTGIVFRDPNKFPPDHKRKGIVSAGSDANEGKWADVDATYPGGLDSLNKFIRKTIRYPEPERRLGKEGEVQVKFMVEKDGSLADIQLVKEVPGAPGFTKETMRLMRAMPKWRPATTDGKTVKVYHILSVKFVLE